MTVNIISWVELDWQNPFQFASLMAAPIGNTFSSPRIASLGCQNQRTPASTDYTSESMLAVLETTRAGQRPGEAAACRYKKKGLSSRSSCPESSGGVRPP